MSAPGGDGGGVFPHETAGWTAGPAPSLTFDPDDELLARVAWSRLMEPGDERATALIAQVGPSEALRALVGVRAPWLQRFVPRLPSLEPRRDLAGIRRLGGRVLMPGDDEWPGGFAALTAPPPCLWVRGPARLDEVSQRSVAVVGARAASTYGEHVAGELASGMADRCFAVVSGLAYGIDGAAHRGALAAEGVSVGVLAGGLDRAYPAGHDTLMGRLAETGAVVSEVPPGSAPTRGRFLQRNRLIAALAGGTVVVEAALRSGSLNTARTAALLGRPVGAVPGPVTSVGSAGCHALLRDGVALLVTDAAEVADLVGAIGADAVVRTSGRPLPADDLDPLAARVLDALPVRSGRPIDRICATAGLDPATVQAALGRLALLGMAQREGTGWRVVRAREQRSTAAELQARRVVRTVR